MKQNQELIKTIKSTKVLMPVTWHIKNKSNFYQYLLDKYVIPKIPKIDNILDFKLKSGPAYGWLGTAVEIYAKLKLGLNLDDDLLIMKGVLLNQEVDKNFADTSKNTLTEKSLIYALNSSSGRIGKACNKEAVEYFEDAVLMEKIEEYGESLIQLLSKYDWSELNEHPIFNGFDLKTQKTIILGDGDLLFRTTLIDIKCKKKEVFSKEDILQQLAYYELANGNVVDLKVEKLKIINPIYNIEFDIPIIEKK